MSELTPEGALFSDEGYHRKKPEYTVPEDWAPEVLSGKVELEMTVHKEHAFEVMDKLMVAYHANTFPYNQDRARLPQDLRHMPETLVRGSVDHGRFWFAVCYYMRGGIKTNRAVQAMSRLYDLRPDIFDPAIVKDIEPNELDAALASVGLGLRSSTVPNWIENARRLDEKYEGDPIRIFDNVTTYEESVALIANDKKGGGFLGFQKKMASMFDYYAIAEGLVDSFPFPPPVDFHVMRVSIANEFVTFGDYPKGANFFSPVLTDALRALFSEYIQVRNEDPIAVSNALWMLSESTCSLYPGNETAEPLGRAKRDGRATILIATKVDLMDPRQQRAYASSCAQCPIEPSCKHSIPGALHYVAGAVAIRDSRRQFPQPLPAPELDLGI